VRLIIEDLEGATTVIHLGSEDVTIGRTPSNTIQLTEQNVSRSHAKLVVRDDGWLVEDLGSYNGVRVNGVDIDGPTLLRERDLIQIGDYHLTLTDKADRATVDIGHPPPAANDSMAMAMASSAELPSVSVDELPANRGAAAAAAGAHRTTREPENSKVGLIVGVLGVILAVGGVSLWLFGGDYRGRSGGDKPAIAEASPNTGGDTPSAATPEPEPPEPQAMVAPDPLGAGSEDETAGDSSAVAQADSDTDPVIEDDSPETDDTGVLEDPVDEPAPAPKPVAKAKPDPKPSAPKLPPAEALAAARKASLTGNNKQAYALAKDAYDQDKSNEALSVMGVAACKMGSESKAKAAYKKMSDSKDKQTLEKICEPLGIRF
jgi:hypothetical protein